MSLREKNRGQIKKFMKWQKEQKKREDALIKHIVGKNINLPGRYFYKDLDQKIKINNVIIK